MKTANTYTGGIKTRISVKIQKSGLFISVITALALCYVWINGRYY